MTRAYILDKYGARLNTAQLAEVLGMPQKTLLNNVYKGEVPIRTYREGGKRWASYEAVADYLDECDEQAKKNPGGEARAAERRATTRQP